MNDNMESLSYLVSLLNATIRLGRQFDHLVLLQRGVDVRGEKKGGYFEFELGAVVRGDAHEVGVEGAEDGFVGDDLGWET